MKDRTGVIISLVICICTLIMAIVTTINVSCMKREVNRVNSEYDLVMFEIHNLNSDYLTHRNYSENMIELILDKVISEGVDINE